MASAKFCRTTAIVRRAAPSARGMARSELPVNTMSAAASPTSLAEPGAIEASAAARAGPSFSPSPTISSRARAGAAPLAIQRAIHAPRLANSQAPRVHTAASRPNTHQIRIFITRLSQLGVRWRPAGKVQGARRSRITSTQRPGQPAAGYQLRAEAGLADALDEVRDRNDDMVPGSGAAQGTHEVGRAMAAAANAD